MCLYTDPHVQTPQTHALNRPLESLAMMFSEDKAELEKMGLTFTKMRFIVSQAFFGFTFLLLSVEGCLWSALENEVLNTWMKVFLWTCFVSSVYLFQGRFSGPYGSFQIWNSGELFFFRAAAVSINIGSFKFFKKFYCVGMFCLHVCLFNTCVPGAHRRRHQIPWN